MQPMVHSVPHPPPGMQHLPICGSQYRIPHRTCCAAGTGVKRKREQQQNQLPPTEAKEFLTWATEAGAKADKLELAMFDGETLHSKTAQLHHSLQHALRFPVLMLRSCPPQTLSCALSLLLAAREGGGVCVPCSHLSCCKHLLHQSPMPRKLTHLIGAAVPLCSQAWGSCYAGLRGMRARQSIASGETLVSIPRQAAVLVTPGMACPVQLAGQPVDATFWKSSPW